MRISKKKSKARVLVVFGTRPELIKLAPLLIGIKELGLLNHFLIVSTAQHFELLKDQDKYWGIDTDIVFSTRNKQDSLTALLANTLLQLQEVIEKYSMLEYVLVQGDTNTALACANLAFLNNKKLLHLEAGLRTHDIKNPFPEEYNRIIASRVAYFHFAPSELSKRNLLAEGVPEESILVTGNTIIDALHLAASKNELKAERNQVLITLHRRENSTRMGDLRTIIFELKNIYPFLQFIWITHPNYPQELVQELKNLPGIEVRNFLPYSDLVQLYAYAAFVITDSGGITEEAIQLGIPTVVFRKETERLEPIAFGLPMLVSQDYQEIKKFTAFYIDADPRPSNCFGNGDASARILKWLQDKLATV